MARVKIAIPDRFSFCTSMEVRVTDLNYGAHLGNDALLGMLHEARLRFFKWLGFDSELDGFDGNGIIMADAALTYKSEAFLGDQLKVEVACDDVSRVGFDVVYRVTHKDNGKEVAIGKTGIIYFDYTFRKVLPLSEELKEQLSG